MVAMTPTLIVLVVTALMVLAALQKRQLLRREQRLCRHCHREQRFCSCPDRSHGKGRRCGGW